MIPNLLMLVAFLTSIGMIFVSVKLLRYLRKRSERRSPLHDRQVGHVPGQQLVHRVDESQENVLLSIVTMYYAFPIMMLGWALHRVPPERLQFDGMSWAFLLAAVLMCAAGAWTLSKHWKKRQSAMDGLIAERVTGMQLNRLIEHGCLVLHDLPADGFNIDHVVIAPRGVYVVETKSFRKPPKEKHTEAYTVHYDGARLHFPDFKDASAISQAERYSQWLSRYLREAKHDVPVIPALALPGWMIQQSDDTWKTSRVKVFSPMGRGADFMSKGFERIDAQHRQTIAQALASRYPRVGTS